MQNRINYLNSVQSGYLSILQAHADILNSDKIGTIDFCHFLDELSHFWLPKIPALNEAVSYISKDSHVRILSGVMYLDHKKYEHFYLKAFGEYHIVIDPMLKLELFVRGSMSKNLAQEVARITKNALNDTLIAIEKCGPSIYYLPIHSMVNYQHKDHVSEVNSLVWMIISNMFRKDFPDFDAFLDHFGSLEQIESSLPQNMLPYLIFTEKEKRNDSLSKKMELYHSILTDLHDGIRYEDSAELFIRALHSQLMQLTDIILTASTLDSGFLIRSYVTFNWMIVLQELFSAHEEYGEMLREAVCFYIFRHVIPKESFNSLNFHEYSAKINEFQLDRKLVEYSDEILRNRELKSFSRIDQKAKSLFDEFSRKTALP